MRLTVCCFIALLTSASFCQEAMSQTRWLGGVSNQWNDIAFGFNNWDSSIPTDSTPALLGNGVALSPIGPGGSITISTPAASVSLPESVAGSVIFYQDSFAGSAVTRSYIVGNAGQNLRIGSSGSITVNSNVAANQTFGANITGSGNLNISNLSSTLSNTLTFDGGVNRGTGTINVSSAAGTIRFNGNVTAQNLVLGAGAGEIIFGNSSSQTISGGITANGATVSGLAQVNNSLTLGNLTTFSPGNGLGAIGNQTINGNLAFNNGSTFQWDLVDIDSISAFDRLTVSGQLSFGDTSQSILNLGVGSFNPMQSWSKTIFSGMTSVAGTFGSISLIGADLGVTASQFSWTHDGGSNLSLSFTAVPEPSTLVLLGLTGITGYLVRRKRKGAPTAVART